MKSCFIRNSYFNRCSQVIRRQNRLAKCLAFEVMINSGPLGSVLYKMFREDLTNRIFIWINDKKWEASWIFQAEEEAANTLEAECTYHAPWILKNTGQLTQRKRIVRCRDKEYQADIMESLEVITDMDSDMKSLWRDVIRELCSMMCIDEIIPYKP